MEFNFSNVISIIQTLAFVGAAVVAVIAIRSNNNNARLRATIDLILAQMQNAALQDAISFSIRLSNENKDLLVLRYNTDFEGRRKLLTHLNSLEFAATGIRRGLFDESVYKHSQYSNVLKSWEMYGDLVRHIREITKIDTLYQDLEYLAGKWSKN